MVSLVSANAEGVVEEECQVPSKQRLHEVGEGEALLLRVGLLTERCKVEERFGHPLSRLMGGSTGVI